MCSIRGSMVFKIKQLPAYLIGIGLILFVVNQPDQPLMNVMLISNLGLLLIYLGIIWSISKIKSVKELSLGSRWVYIPLLVIVVSIIISSLLSGASNKFALALFAPTLFALYVLGRYYGETIFKPFLYGVIIVSTSLVIGGIINPGIKQGGLISPTNYDMATGFLVFGTLVCVWRKQWILTFIALIGLFFTGADEAIFSVAVIFATVLIRRDFSRKLVLPIAALSMMLIIAIPLGITTELYSPTVQKVESATEGNWLQATGYRLTGNWQISELKPFGTGYYVSWNDNYRGKIPHNVPLIIVEQIGIAGALAWCVVAGYCLIKTKWKYAWVGLLSLCVFDHFIWSMCAPWFWVLAGVSTASDIKNDYIFKNES